MKPHQIFMTATAIGAAALVTLLVLAGNGVIETGSAQTHVVSERS